MYGSSVNSLMMRNNSDLDVTLIIDGKLKVDNLLLLQGIENVLRSDKYKQKFRVIKVIPASRVYYLEIKHV